MPPEMNPNDPLAGQQASPAGAELPNGELDREGAMAKADLHKLAQYSFKLFKKIQDEDQLEAWVQAKITKAADYIASVYHYLEYEMEFSEYGQKLENSEMYSEGQKAVLKARLNEAKEKIKALKVSQANKNKVEEGIFGGDHAPCDACGGSGHVVTPERTVPEHVKAKVAKYNRQAKAMRAASKRIDKNKNGIPDEDEMEEDFGGSDEKEMKVGDKKKTRTGELTKTSTGVMHKNTSYADGGDDDIAQRSGKGIKTHAKSQSAAEKKAQAPKQKQSPKSAKTWGMKDNEKFDNRDKEKEVDETYGQGVYEGNEPKDKPRKGEKISKEGNAFGKAIRDAKASGDKTVTVGGKTMPVKEAAKPDFLDMDKDGNKKEPMKKAVADKKKNPFAKKVDEEAKQTMSRAAKGIEKYGKDGMQALAKAGKEGKDLDKVRDKYDKYDESAPSAGLSAAKKSAVVKKAKAGGDIGKPGKSFDKVAKAAGGGKKGEKIAAAAMWKNKVKAVKEAAEEKKAKKDYDGDGKIESGKDEHAGSVDNAIKANKKETVKESADTTRIRQLMQRLNG